MNKNLNINSIKIVKREDVLPDFDPNKYSVTINYDMSQTTEDKIFLEIIEDEIDKLRILLCEKMKGIPRGEQLNNKLDEIYEIVKNY